MIQRFCLFILRLYQQKERCEYLPYGCLDLTEKGNWRLSCGWSDQILYANKYLSTRKEAGVWGELAAKQKQWTSVITQICILSAFNMQWISWRQRRIHYVDRCLDSAIHHSSLLLHFQRFQECATQIQTHQDNFKFFSGSVLCIRLIPRLNIHCFKLQRLSTQLRLDSNICTLLFGGEAGFHLHSCIVSAWLGEGSLLVGGGGFAVLSIVCKFLPVFFCCATHDMHVGTSERRQQTALLFRHTRTHGADATVQPIFAPLITQGLFLSLAYTNHHSNTNRKISSSGTMWCPMVSRMKWKWICLEQHPFRVRCLAFSALHPRTKARSFFFSHALVLKLRQLLVESSWCEQTLLHLCRNYSGPHFHTSLHLPSCVGRQGGKTELNSLFIVEGVLCVSSLYIYQTVFRV